MLQWRVGRTIWCWNQLVRVVLYHTQYLGWVLNMASQLLSEARICDKITVSIAICRGISRHTTLLLERYNCRACQNVPIVLSYTLLLAKGFAAVVRLFHRWRGSTCESVLVACQRVFSCNFISFKAIGGVLQRQQRKLFTIDGAYAICID